MSDNGSNGNGHSDKEEKPLASKWEDFITKKKAATHCETCSQSLPTNGHTPYRDDPSPVEETVEDSTPFTIARSKVREAWKFLQDHTPTPIKWMFRSVAWILVGTAVAGAFIGASYFLVRYLVWYLLIALGKWLLERIGRGLPRFGAGDEAAAMHYFNMSANNSQHTNEWLTGALIMIGVAGLCCLGTGLYYLGKGAIAVFKNWKETR